MNDFPWLTTLIVVPLIGAVVTGAMPQVPGGQLVKRVGLGFSLAALVVGALMATQYSVGGGLQLNEVHDWIKPLGVHYALGVDGLGLLMMLLTLVLVPVVLLASWWDADASDDSIHSRATLPDGSTPAGSGSSSSVNAFVAWTLALEALSLAVFAATDVFLFYVVFEATLIPAYFLIGGFGRPGRSRAAVKFLVYQLAGGLIMLASVIGLYVASARAGSPTYLLTELTALNLDDTTGRWLFLGFFIAFAIKAPMFPVHTWLADTTEKATTGTSVLLVCVLDKIGTFGMLRFCLGLFPEASQWATPVVVILALISIVYGALVAIGQDDVLRLIGLTSLSHFGFIVLGIFVFNANGGSGAILYMVNHGIGTAALFLIAGYLIRRTGTPLISRMGGQEKATPVLAGTFLVAGLAACGLPGLAPFVSEMLVIISAFDHAWWAGATAVSGIVLAAIYILWMYQRTMTGPEPVAQLPGVGDLNAREVGAVAPLLIGLLVFGFYPMPVLNVINPYVEDTLVQVGVTDPGPTVPPGTEILDEAEGDSNE